MISTVMLRLSRRISSGIGGGVGCSVGSKNGPQMVGVMPGTKKRKDRGWAWHGTDNGIRWKESTKGKE